MDAFFPARWSAASAVRDDAIGQLSSAVPCWIRTGSVIREKKLRAERLRQNAGFRSGAPSVLMMVLARPLRPRGAGRDGRHRAALGRRRRLLPPLPALDDRR